MLPPNPRRHGSDSNDPRSEPQGEGTVWSAGSLHSNNTGPPWGCFGGRCMPGWYRAHREECHRWHIMFHEVLGRRCLGALQRTVLLAHACNPPSCVGGSHGTSARPSHARPCATRNVTCNAPNVTGVQVHRQCVDGIASVFGFVAGGEAVAHCPKKVIT